MNTNKRCIIIVDDYDDQLEMMKTAIEQKTDFDVQTASSGRELINLLVEGRCLSAIILDVNLPGELGTTLAREIKEARPNTPIAFLTAYTHSAAINADALRMGIPVWDKVEMSDLTHLIESIERLAQNNAHLRV